MEVTKWLNSKRRCRDGRDRALSAFLATRLKHRLCHLLDEQRYAIGALHDVLLDTRDEQLVAGNSVDHGSDFVPPQPIKGECCDVRPSPRRLEFGSKRDDQ